MALAMIYPETSPGKRTNGSATTCQKLTSFLLLACRKPAPCAPTPAALAEDVLADRVPLDKALERVRSE